MAACLVGEVLGVLQQRPASVLEALGGLLVTEGAQLVPVVAADLVQCFGGERDDVVAVDADRRLRGVLAGALGVPGSHVHRDRSELR